MPETGANENGPIISRRGFLKIALITGGAAALKGFLNDKSQETPHLSLEQNSAPEQQVLNPNDILSLPLFTPERKQIETTYVKYAKTLNEVDQGFRVVTDINLRMNLLEKRAGLRQMGKEGLQPLTEKEEAWCFRHGIYPETLALCKENYEKAREAINTLKKEIREDFKDNESALEKIDAETFMINIGGMAELVLQETGHGRDGLHYGFVNIGSEKAYDAINPKAFPDAQQALKILCQSLRDETGLNYDPHNIPGSQRAGGDSSGGAIGPQFMPGNALKMHTLLKKAGLNFNPFDLSSGLIGSWIFLATEEVFSYNDPNNRRFGYYKGKPDNCLYALEKWNPKPEEYHAIYNTAVEFYQSVLNRP